MIDLARGLIFLGLLLMLVTQPPRANAAEGDTFLRMHGFGSNYGLVGETSGVPNPPEFHLDLKLRPIFTENLPAKQTSDAIASYLQRTVERVFSEMVGTGDDFDPFTTPSYRLVNKRTAH